MFRVGLDYICNGDKTDDEIYASTHLCRKMLIRNLKSPRNNLAQEQRLWLIIWANPLCRKKVDEGKVYHSYYGSYMNIRNQSDRLCREHNLSVIDLEKQKEINEIKRRKFVSWHDWNEDKKGSSYKSRLQFDIDRSIKQSINWKAPAMR